MLFPCLPGLLRRLQKQASDDSGWQRPGLEECLPQDALETIMGFLDRETLCSARLVSKAFCAAASAHVCSLTLASTSKAVSFHRYPHLRHVTVKHHYPHILNKEESLAQLDPCLRDLATALTVRNYHYYEASIPETRDCLSQAPLMPKLRTLSVMGRLEHEAALLARCTNLEAIRCDACSLSVARTIITMTRLTSLHILDVRKDGGHAPSTDISWLEDATNLRGLQALSIFISGRTLPLIGNLTSLTGLTLYDGDGSYSIAPLTRLTRLRSLNLGRNMTESDLGNVCFLGSGSLINMELSVCREVPADCGRYLSCQTALTCLTLGGRKLGNLRHIGALRIELLQCLKIDDLDVLDAGGLSVLCRATSLTKLRVVTYIEEPQVGLSQVLARLAQLRSLTWRHAGQYYASKGLDVPLAVSPLTGLTELGAAGPDTPASACAGSLLSDMCRAAGA